MYANRVFSQVWRLGLAGLATVLLIAGDRVLAQGRGQQDPYQAPPTAAPSGLDRPSPEVLIAPNEDYRIAPGDTIDVTVQDAPELSITARMSASGTFEMPFLGVLKGQGKTLSELAAVIADQLRDQDYLKQPQVRILIRQYNSQTFFIHGTVRNPGVYLVEGRPTIMKLITLAGGMTDGHGSTALVMRPVASAPATATPGTAAAPPPKPQPQPQPEIGQTGLVRVPPKGLPGSPADDGTLPADAMDSGQYELIRANIAAIYEGRFEQNVLIEPGDIVYIPPADVFFVAGEVNAPGSFKLKDGTTLRQAISLAQGTTFKAKLGRGIIFRDNSKTGKRDEIHVDIADVMSGKKDDLPILPNDVIIVPNSRAKSVSSSLLSALGISAAQRVPVR
ncbi:MAG TPA: polysaccharide biosynthesis/export family protein [Blastocatellia bacterium]|nr:polysaccharide biosynthesis/export family protein [Blastocatellia bacterium]